MFTFEEAFSKKGVNIHGLLIDYWLCCFFHAEVAHTALAFSIHAYVLHCHYLRVLVFVLGKLPFSI